MSDGMLMHDIGTGVAGSTFTDHYTYPGTYQYQVGFRLVFDYPLP
jgi:hypothetical protein